MSIKSIFKCKYCEKEYDNIDLFKDHLLQHNFDIPFKDSDSEEMKESEEIQEANSYSDIMDIEPKLKREDTYDMLVKSGIPQDINPNTEQKKADGYDWNYNTKREGKEAIKLADYLFKNCDTIGLMGYQIDILREILKFGINEVQCSHYAKNSLKEIWALWDMESDEGEGSGDPEDILCNVLQYGVVTKPTAFTVYNARQYKGDKIYKKIINLLDNDKEKTLEILNDLIQLWLTNIENITDKTYYSCYKKYFYTVSEFSDKMKNIKKVLETGGEAFTFEEIYNYYIPEDEGPWQYVVDIWDKMLEKHDSDIFT